MKKILIIVFALFLLFEIKVYAEDNEKEIIKAKVIDAQNTDDGILYSAEILEGEYKGNQFTDTFRGMKYTQLDYPLKKGVIIYISIEESNGSLNVNIEGVYRNKYLKILMLIFVLVLILIGRKMGLFSLISLTFTGACILFIYIPLILKGFDIIFITILSCFFIVSISFIIISGLTKKSLSAIIGTLGGVLAAFILIKIFSQIMCITGTIEENVYLLVFEYGVELDFSKLFISGVMIGTIGVLMDVSMSVTSVIFEIKEHSPKASFGQLIHSGINVGKDVMATMVNTLILAYAGTAMPLFFWAANSSASMQSIFNLEQVSGEIIRALCGSIGLILAVPITAITASYIVSKNY